MSGTLPPEEFLRAVERELATRGYYRSNLELPTAWATVTITDHLHNGDTQYRVHAETRDSELLRDFDSLEEALRGADSLARRLIKQARKQQEGRQ